MTTPAIDMKTKLTSSEIGNLWTSYMGDSMLVCVLKYFLHHVEDEEIRSHIESALQLSQQHLQQMTTIFSQEKMAIPHGFTDEDVNINAPRLFSDAFILVYIYKMTKQGLEGYSLFLTNSVRKDVVEFYSDCLKSFNHLHNQVLDTMLAKGVLARPPIIPAPEKVDFVDKQQYLAGWFGEKRPLNAIEIGRLFYNIQRNVLGRGLVLGFAQTAKSKEVRKFMMRGKEIADKHVEVFSSVLSENDIPAPTISDSMPTAATEAPFSDKLMMFHVTTLISMSIFHYGLGIGTGARRDIGALYTRIAAETARYLEDGANIMIDNKWMEQPPTAPNREELTRH